MNKTSEKVVIWKLVEETLIDIADEANGEYIIGNNTEKVVNEIREILNRMDKKEFEAKKFVSYKDQFKAFLFAAFLLILAERLVFSTQTQWIKRLNLFNEASTIEQDKKKDA